MSGRVFFGGLLFWMSGGRITTRPVRQALKAERDEWARKCAEMQAELDAERTRGWGFRKFDGRRVDWR